MPMGTIVTACMLIGLLVGTAGIVVKPPKALPKWLLWPMGGIVFVAGAWNTFWYAVQHLTEFWGLAALGSGIVMMLVGISIFRGTQMPKVFQSIQPLMLLCLLGFFLLYAITIYRL